MGQDDQSKTAFGSDDTMPLVYLARQWPTWLKGLSTNIHICKILNWFLTY